MRSRAQVVGLLPGGQAELDGVQLNVGDKVLGCEADGRILLCGTKPLASVLPQERDEHTLLVMRRTNTPPTPPLIFSNKAPASSLSSSIGGSIGGSLPLSGTASPAPARPSPTAVVPPIEDYAMFATAAAAQPAPIAAAAPPSRRKFAQTSSQGGSSAPAAPGWPPSFQVSLHGHDAIGLASWPAPRQHLPATLASKSCAFVTQRPPPMATEEIRMALLP